MNSLLEPTLELSLRHTYKGGYLGESQWFLHITFHELEGFFQFCVFSTDVLAQRRALALFVAAPVGNE